MHFAAIAFSNFYCIWNLLQLTGNWRYRDTDERIFNLLNQINGNASVLRQTIWEFLRVIAHNFCMD